MATRQDGTYREGDLIRATKNETTIRGRLQLVKDVGLRLDDAGWSLVSLKSQGWTIEIIEMAQPTEPGAYHDKDGDLWYRDRDGNWYDLSDLGVPNSPWSSYPAPFEPFVKLEAPNDR